MFGKHFESMYEGSMIGAGSHVFAVMGYVISKMRPDAEVGAQVDLNPRLLSKIFGDDEKRVVQAIEYLCAPDPDSTTPDEGGRRLIRLGQYAYRVVNGPKYMALKNEEARRVGNRDRMRTARADKKAGVVRVPRRGKPLAGKVDPATGEETPGESSVMRGIDSGMIDPATMGRAAEPPDMATLTPASQQVPVTEAPPAADQNGPVAVRPANPVIRPRAPWSPGAKNPIGPI